MFDISWGELVLIGMVALIVIGPKELPTVLRTVGQWVAKVKRMAAEFQGQFHDAMREAELADLRKQVESIGDTAKITPDFNPIETARKEIEGALQDNPAAASGAAQPAAEPAGAAVMAAEPVSGIQEALVPADAPPAPPAEAALAPAVADGLAPPVQAASQAPERPAAPIAPDLGGGRAA
jgi:sec-independent protein translocase protein TatB